MFYFLDKTSPSFCDDKLEILHNYSVMKSLIAWQFSQEYIWEFPVYEPFYFDNMYCFLPFMEVFRK